MLLAGLRIEQRRFSEATNILNSVASSAPDDLWIYLDRLRVKAATVPTPEIARVLLAFLNDPQFPPNARLTAADAAKAMSAGVSQEDHEAIYKGMIAAEPTPDGCTVTEYASWLITSAHRIDDARALLESYVAGHRQCPSRSQARVLLAYTYLAAAADIAPTQTAANAEWFRRTEALLAEEDYLELAAWLQGAPRGLELWPLVAHRLPPELTDNIGRTRLCNAVQALDVEVARTELQRGADPDQDCDGSALTWSVMIPMDLDRVDERRSIVRLLLEHGGTRIDPQSCEIWMSPDCPTVFGPILAEFGR